ncbi:hypothetical protein VSDG_08550 [Cytospora chrysosperma]|uniref:Uncharacterized protein n=1 Tax=Cytospora chrysosperma TaxID=252740 RepID=A0A423VFA4_CYTCH|nr:hypothetical protein VSDG_08550 [Valsa sordida]
MSDVFQRTGRGGAGNYYSQKDIEEAEKAQRANVSHDPEAQKTTNSPPPPAAPAAAEAPTSAPQYVRIGRGGAGNWTDSPTTAETQHRQHAADHTTAAVSAAAAGRPRAGLTGRGGAGNWTGGGDNNNNNNNNAEGLEEEKAEQQRIAARIRQDIDASLPAPPKTYHQHDREMEK